jgi:tetratricopeptide (TPR) repeat protein
MASSSAGRPKGKGGSRRRQLLPLLCLLLIAVAGVSVWIARRPAVNPSPTSATTSTSAPSLDAPSAEERALLDAAERAPKGEATPHQRLGEFHLSSGRPFEAIWAFASTDAAAGRDVPAGLGLARALEAGLLHADAIALLERLVAREPGNREAITRLAELRLRTGRPDEALRALRHSPALVTTADGALLEGRVYEALGDVRRAEAAYQRATAGNERAGDGWHRLGRLSLSQGRISDARQALQRARDLDPSDRAVLTDLGRSWAAGRTPGEQKQALGFFEEVVRAQAFAPAYYQAALLLKAGGRIPQAMAALGRATKADPELADAYRELATLLERSGRRTEARYQRGLYYSVKDLRVRSLREYLAMAEADPSRPDGLLLASQSHFKMQQNARALEVARRALARFPGNRDAREQVAALAILTTQRQEAERLCADWLREDPGAAEPLWMLGRIAVDSLRFDEGIARYEQALAKQPENPAFLQSLGEALLNAPGSQHLARAIEILTRAVAVAPRDAKVRAQLGEALTRAGRAEEARRQMLRSLDLDPNRGPSYNTVVQLARQLRRPGPLALFAPMVRTVEQRLREELTLWRRTWDRPEEPQGYRDLARFLIRTGDPKRAESQLEEAARLRPGWPEAEAELARVRRLRSVLE